MDLKIVTLSISYWCITFVVRSICFALFYGEVPDPRTLPNFGHRIVTKKFFFANRFSDQVSVWYQNELIFYLRSKVLNNCNRLSYMMFESRKRPELGTIRTILGSW